MSNSEAKPKCLVDSNKEYDFLEGRRMFMETMNKISSGELQPFPRMVNGKMIGIGLFPRDSSKDELRINARFVDHKPNIELDEVSDEETLTSVDITMQSISRMNANHRSYETAKMIEDMYESQKKIDSFQIPMRAIYPKLNSDRKVGEAAMKKVFENDGKCVSQPGETCICNTYIQTGQCACGIFENVDIKYYKYGPDMNYSNIEGRDDNGIHSGT